MAKTSRSLAARAHPLRAQMASSGNGQSVPDQPDQLARIEELLVSIQHDAEGCLHVLLADADDDTREVYRVMFEQCGVELDEAVDGRVALAKALERPHDMIVTETRLPGIDGYALCDLLRRDPATEATPIVLITGDGCAATAEHAVGSGADSVLVKPCEPDVLLTALRRLCRRSEHPRREALDLQSRVESDTSRALGLRARIHGRRTLSKSFRRGDTMTPPTPPPSLRCPRCDQSLVYEHSHVGGASERHVDQWDYFACGRGCGRFQYRQRTRKLRRL